jgi:prepilin-type N-terminal cleavage/methylation domain-containing protein
MFVNNNRGFTITELIIVMAIFMVVIMVTTQSFNTAVGQMKQQSKSAETQIEGIVGLEMFRADLEQAGFGLPWVFQSTPNASIYTEMTAGDTLADLTATKDFSNPPRAILSGATTFNGGSKYLVIKSVAVGTSATAKKWTTVRYDGNTKIETTWGSAERDFTAPAKANERVIVIRTTFSNGVPTRQLAVNSSTGNFSTVFDNYTTMTFPRTTGDVFQIYGVDPGSNLHMPFNRADYFISNSGPMAPTCAPNTGILFKAVANQSGTSFTKIPLLDCVADMEVVYGLDNAQAGFINSHITTAPADAETIRTQLKEIRVYILAQEGQKDPSYSYPNRYVNVGENFGGGLQGRVFDLETISPTEWKKFRWKIYTIVVRPKNLIQ